MRFKGVFGKAKHDVATTPQTFIDDERIGGFDDLNAYFGKETKEKDATTYAPVIALFGVAGMMSRTEMRLRWWGQQSPSWFRIIDGKPDDDRDGGLDALEAVMDERLTLHLVEGVAIYQNQ